MNDVEFFERLKTQFNINLTKSQKEAAVNIDGPSLVLAVPGSGKTTLLLSRTAYLITNGIKPENILSVTFSKMSAKDMESRFDKIFGNLIKDKVQFSTIHSLAYSIVREYNRKNNVHTIMIEGTGDKGSMPSVTKMMLLRNIYKKINRGVMTEEESEDLASKIGFVKNMMISNDELDDYDWGIDNFSKIYLEYEKIKRENSYIDFDDMLSECLTVLRKDKTILDRYQYRYKYIQVDEAQDTSKVQHKIIQLLGNKNNNIFYVADDDQSIYGFRGAFPEFLLNIKDIYKNVKVIFMEENFRSTPDIISVCNKLIKTNKNRFDKNIFTNNASLDPIQILTVKNKEEQLTNVITKLNKRDTSKSIAVLYRNNISSVLLADLLSKAGISYKIKGFKKHFFEHWMINDVFNIINVALNNNDIDSFEKIYYKLNGYYISKGMIFLIKKDTSDKTIFQKMLDIPSLKDYEMDNIIKLTKDFKILANRKIEAMFEFIEYGLGYKQITSSNRVIFDTLKVLARGLSTLDELKQKMNELKSNMEKSVFNRDKNPVILTTSHSSKGLEWDKVYLIDIEDNVFPTVSSIKESRRGNLKELEEERRLYYVSMTRAKSELILYKLNDSSSMFIKEVEASMRGLVKKVKTSNPEVKKVNNKAAKETVTKADIKKLKEVINNYKTESVYVNHKKFGLGLVRDLREGNIEILFNDELIKTFSFDFCCKNNLLKLIS